MDGGGEGPAVAVEEGHDEGPDAGDGEVAADA